MTSTLSGRAISSSSSPGTGIWGAFVDMELELHPTLVEINFPLVLIRNTLNSGHHGSSECGISSFKIWHQIKFSNLAHELATGNDPTHIMGYDSYKTAATSSEEREFYELGNQFFMIDCYIQVVTNSGNMVKINNNK